MWKNYRKIYVHLIHLSLIHILTLITGPEDIYKNEINEFYSLQDKYPKLKFENKTVGFKSEEEIKEVFSKFSKREDIVLFYNPNSSTSSKIVKDTSTTLGSVRQILSAIEGTTEAPIFTTTNLGIEYGMMGGYTCLLYTSLSHHFSIHLE